MHKIANKHCKGRLISVLEGGYNIQGNIMSPLAQSVALHVDYLRNRSKKIYQELSKKEMEFLAEFDEKKEEERKQTSYVREKEDYQRNKRTKREPEKVEEADMVDIEVEEDVVPIANNIVDSLENTIKSNPNNVNDGNNLPLLANSQAVIGSGKEGDKKEGTELNIILNKVK